MSAFKPFRICSTALHQLLARRNLYSSAADRLCPFLVFVAGSSWLHRQGSADQFFAVADKDMTIGIDRRSPGDFSPRERESGFQLGAAAVLFATFRPAYLTIHLSLS